MSILSELLGAKHREQLLQKQYKLESARQMIESEAKEPGTFDPRMIQLAADTLQMGVVPKEHEGGFHRALGAVLPHIFGKKAPEKPANEGAMSSAGSAAPQAAMMPPPMPPPATADPGASSPILSLNAPQAPISPPPGAAPPPMSPLPASLGQAGSGVGAGPTGPAVPSDTTAPQPLPGIRSDPGQGWTSLGVTPSTTAPPPAPVTQPAGPLLRHGTQQIPFHINTRAERVQANAPGVLAQAGLEAQVNAQRYAQMKARLEEEDWFKALSPRQKATVLTGQNITSELRPMSIPGTAKGSTAPPGTMDYNGDPVTPDMDYRRERDLQTGQLTWIPTSPSTVFKTINDPQTGKSYMVTYDRQGKEISRVETVNPALLKTEATTDRAGTAQKVVNVDGKTTTIPATASSRVTVTRGKVIPGLSAPPGATTAPASPMPSSAAPRPNATRPAATTPAADTGSLPRGSRVLGDNNATFRMKAENPLTIDAMKRLEDTEPKLASVRRIKTVLEQYKNSNVPFSTLIPRIEYAVGVAPGGLGGFLSELELNRIGSAARLVAGTSRAGSILEKAMIHTPDAWKDSGKLMYDKITKIEQALNDIVGAAKKNGQRYPGLDRGVGTPPAVAPPPTARKPLSEIFAQ